MLQGIRFRVALFCWARLLPILAYRRDLKSLVDLADPPDRTPYAGLSSGAVVGHVRRTTHRRWFMRDRPCLRDGVLAFRFLKLAGFEPEVHFGIDRTSVAQDRLSAHCWVVVDGIVVLNPPVPSMLEILVLRAESGRSSRLDGIAVSNTEGRAH